MEKLKQKLDWLIKPLIKREKLFYLITINLILGVINWELWENFINEITNKL